MPPSSARWCWLRANRGRCDFLLRELRVPVERLAGLRFVVVLLLRVVGLRLLLAAGFFLAGALRVDVFLRVLVLRDALTVVFFLVAVFFFGVVLFDFAIRSIGAISRSRLRAMSIQNNSSIIAYCCCSRGSDVFRLLL